MFRCVRARWDEDDAEVHRGVQEGVHDLDGDQGDRVVVPTLPHQQPHGHGPAMHPYGWFCR